MFTLWLNIFSIYIFFSFFASHFSSLYAICLYFSIDLFMGLAPFTFVVRAHKLCKANMYFDFRGRDWTKGEVGKGIREGGIVSIIWN